MFEIESNPVLLYPFSIFLFNYIRNRLLHTHNFFYLAHVFGEIRMIDIWERRIIFQIIFHNKLSPRILNISIFHILQTWMIFTNYFQYLSSIIQNLIILIIKYYIYITKFTTSKNLNFENLKTIVVNRLYIEKFILLKTANIRNSTTVREMSSQNIEHSS